MINKVTIATILPYKENYSPTYPGAVSLFVHSTTKISKWKTFFQKMFGIGEILVHKLAKFYEKLSEMGLESTVLDETRGKWSQIA